MIQDRFCEDSTLTVRCNGNCGSCGLVKWSDAKRGEHTQ